MRAPAVAAACVVVVSLAGVAAAQPGRTPVGPPIPPPYTYQPAPPSPQLTQDEIELLADGEITDGQHIGGGVASLFLGFGIGHAVQGRWSSRGWIFTLGESASVGLLIYGFAQNDCFLAIGHSCSDDDDGVGEAIVGLVAFSVFRVWEIIDAFAAPPNHNRRVRELRMRLGYPPPAYGGLQPYVVPSAGGDGAVGGVTLRF
jgi:hypothetical protein